MVGTQLEPVIGYQKLIVRLLTSILSDYMITIFQDRHSGMDCRYPGPMDVFELTIHSTEYPFLSGYDELEHNLTK